MTSTPAPTTYSFSGVFTQAQTKTHRLHTVTVPADASAMDLSFSYSPDRVGRHGNKLTITLLDPDGFRGEAHRGGPRQTIHVDGQTATPGFIPGRLPPGEWMVRLNAPAALASDPPLHYELQVTVATGTAAGAPVVWSAAPGRVLSTQPGWYRGELHSHTFHSDGHWTLAQLWQRAGELGLDFLVLTDHNTVSGISEAADLPARRPLFIPGLEITSFHGHALAFGVNRWIDWRSRPDERTAERWIDETHRAGGLFAIAHPFTEGDPGCTGCSWEHGLPQPGPSDRVEAVEICNEYWTAPSNDNPMCLALWRRLQTPDGGPTAIVGTDAHGSTSWGPQSLFTWVYASELSAAGILGGIRNGHVIISGGPWLKFSAVVNGAAAGMPGSHVSADDVTLRMAWRDAPSGAKLRLMKGMDTLRSEDAHGAGEMEVTMKVTEASWYGAEIWSAEDAPLVITNPIYVKPA